MDAEFHITPKEYWAIVEESKAENSRKDWGEVRLVFPGEVIVRSQRG